MIKQYKLTQAIFHITYACEHHCPMCYANASSNYEHPPIIQLCDIVDKLEILGIRDITLVGGDPVLYPQIEELIYYIKKKNIRLSVLSNTLDFGLKRDAIVDYIDVYEGTIHHSNRERHDRFCGCNGAYDKLIENLRYFSLKGKSAGLALNLIPFNYDKIYDIVFNVVNQNVKLDHIILQRIIQFGRATDLSCYELTNEMVNKIMQQIGRIESDFDVNIIFEDPLPLCSVEKKYQKYMHPCDWGLTKVSVDYNGNLSRCGADVFHSFGSVFDDDILDKWNTDETLSDFRDKCYLPSKCISCSLFEKCGGGCPISRHPEKGFSLDYLAKV